MNARRIASVSKCTYAAVPKAGSVVVPLEDVEDFAHRDAAGAGRGME